MNALVPLLRMIPPVRGKHRLARALLRGSLGEGSGDVRDRHGCRYAVPTLREPIAFALLVDGAYEPDAVDLVLACLRGGGTFVDVGANVGCFALPAARRLTAGGSVLALEASPSIYRYLVENIRSNGLEVHALQCAALDAEGTTPFHEAPSAHFGMGSIAPQFGASPIEVPARRLDSILAELGIGKVAVVKADVEGYEFRVFGGAEGLLTGAQPPLVVFEFCDWAENRAGLGAGRSQRLLREWGYSIWTLDAYLRGGEPLDRIMEKGFETLVASRAGRAHR